MDYRALLSKYMRIVGENEGVSFVPESCTGWPVCNVELTEEELSELKQIEDETTP